MNYVWDVIILARRLGVDLKNINFIAAKSYSPYMELSFKYINGTAYEGDIEVNPYYRFYEIFKDLFNINNTEDVELRETLFDILMHFLSDIDTYAGMSKREFYKRFLLKDLNSGLFGSDLKEKMQLFSKDEQDILAHNIIKLYISGDMLYLFKDTLRRIFKNPTVYVNYEAKDELLIYIREERTDLNEAKMEFIKEIFLPIKFRTEIYWNYHFGIIGVDETMIIGNIALY